MSVELILLASDSQYAHSERLAPNSFDFQNFHKGINHVNNYSFWRKYFFVYG